MCVHVCQWNVSMERVNGMCFLYLWLDADVDSCTSFFVRVRGHALLDGLIVCEQLS